MLGAEVVLLLYALIGLAFAGPRIAVLEFTNAADDASLDPLGKGLQSMVTTDLSGVKSVTLVERSRMTELKSELELGQDGWTDPKTVAQLGKLSGASHLLGGSYTVLGAEMRLDAQMVDVETGKILFAEKMAGERDAFFELQKDLVDKLVRTLQVTLTPKERAAVRRLHTADFDAFKEFSLAIDHFDAARYDEALASMGLAVEHDEDFKLARLTLDEYEERIEALRDRADAIEVSKASRARLAEIEEASDGAKVMARLIALGDGDDVRTQATALYLLACLYKGNPYGLRTNSDRFAMDRARDHFSSRYFDLALPLWPRIPLIPRDGTFLGDPPELETFDEDFERYAELLWEGVHNSPRAYWKSTRTGFLERNASERLFIGYLAQYRHLDAREEALFRLERVGWLETLDRPVDLAREWDQLLREALRLDAVGASVLAADLLDRMGKATDDEHQLRRLADHLQVVKQHEALRRKKLDALPGEIVHVGLSTRHPMPSIEGALADLESDRTAALAVLAKLRRLDEHSIDSSNVYPFLLDGHPLWTVQRDEPLYSGPRTDARRGSGLRYYEGSERAKADTLLVLDGVPREAVGLTMTLSHTIAGDFHTTRERLAREDLVRDMPTVGVVLGWKDLRVDPVEDSETRARVQESPMSYTLVRFTDGAVEVVQRRAAPELQRKVETWEETVLGTIAWKRGRTDTITVRARKKHVEVVVAGKKHGFSAPELGRGFYGLMFAGRGYAQIDGLVIEGASN